MSVGSDRERVSVDYRISGRVQGVGFRWWTVKVATELGIAGSVRNAPDGTVAVHAAGPRSAVEAFERALRVGPPAARVDGVHAADDGGGHDVAEPDDGFEIER